jgi:hypothetical protein
MVSEIYRTEGRHVAHFVLTVCPAELKVHVVIRASKQALFDESAMWIRSNPHAMLHDVPDRLVQCWVCDLEDASAPTGFHLSIFTFGYCQRQLLVTAAPANMKMSVPADTVLSLFQMWQLKLGLIEVHRKTELRIGPLALFDFPQGETIEYWRTVIPHTP